MTDREQLASELHQLIQHIRNHVPDAVINTRLAHGDDSSVIVHAQIMGGSGSSAGAHASATPGDVAAEQAENRAIARAIIAMGLPPVADPTPVTRLHSVPQTEVPSRVVPFPSHELDRSESPAASDDEPLEDLSWTAFWKWARSHGYANREALEAVIGQSINQLTPAQARKLAQDAAPNR